jgi:hypothetical protein
MTGQFRILCDGLHGEGAEESEEEVLDAVAEELEVIPLRSPGEPRPITPPL